MNTTTETKTYEIAQTIRVQLGGVALFAMGASHLAAGDDFLQFSIKGSRTINKIKITLDPSDTYTVEFWKISRGRAVLVASDSMVYCDQLHGIIEGRTGLFLSPFRRA